MRGALSTPIISATLVVLLLLSGCSSFKKNVDSIGSWASAPIMPPIIAPVDLIAMMSGGVRTGKFAEGAKKGGDIDPGEFSNKFSYELAQFENLGDAEYVQRRNLIQDRLRVASDELCYEYRTSVARKQSRGNFILGTSALLFSGLGALTNVASVAKGFSGASAFATGTRNEINQDFYVDQTITLISRAIETEQSILRRDFDQRRASSRSSYSLLLAINDVSRYHSTCSLAAALKFADDSVKTVATANGLAVKDATSDQVKSEIPKIISDKKLIPEVKLSDGSAERVPSTAAGASAPAGSASSPKGVGRPAGSR